MDGYHGQSARALDLHASAHGPRGSAQFHRGDQPSRGIDQRRAGRTRAKVGVAFAPNLRVTEISSDEQLSHHQNGMIFMGDYIDIDSSPGMAHLVWVDTRNQVADVFVATVQRPGANPTAS